MAFSQIDRLYRPLLAHIYGVPVTGIQVCKHLTRRPARPFIECISEVVSPGRDYTWHWLG